MVENPEALREILRGLGFADVAVVRKEREIYEYGDVKICMDSVEGLGLFVELEKRGKDRIKGEEELFSLAGKIGLTRFERKSYLELKLEREVR
jgi:adenylate cyclase class 2